MNILRNMRYLQEAFLGHGGFNSGSLARNFCQNLEPNKRLLFFNEDVQNILKSLTRVDYDKLFRHKKLGKKITNPLLKFMTDKELEEARLSSLKKAEKMLQMPPVLPPRAEINHVLVKDEKLVGYSSNKYVFTDITYGKDDRSRHIVVRDTDGTLRKASWQERERCNEIYFPRHGRKFRVPLMFKPEYLEDVLNRGCYLFVLQRACAQFEPDDPMYISVTQRTYDKIAETKSFSDLESTRFFGPMVYYYTQQQKLSPLLVYFFSYDRLENILKVIQLHNILHPDNQCSSSHQQGDELSLVKAFIADQYPNNSELELALKSYEDYITKPKSQAVM